ncbi:hypothetical protein ABBQ38_013907 [Trebouxia sp. C0009 RCD-2024]
MLASKVHIAPTTCCAVTAQSQATFTQEKIECSNMRLGRQLHTCALGWRLIPELKLEFPAFPVKTSAQRTELLELAAVPLPGQLPAQHRARHILVETRAVLSSCA